MEIRILTEGDRAAAQAFLVQHCDSSMLLLSNIHRRGFEYTGQQWSATYVGAFEGERIEGIIAHSWNGMLLMQASVHAEQLAPRLVQLSGREVNGFIGPRDQVRRIRRALALADTRARLDEDEDLYALPLDALREPPPASEVITCRPAESRDLDVLIDWRVAYEIEGLGASDNEATRRQSAQGVGGQVQAGHAWVATSGERLLSYSAFNAALPSIVQLGGIYTPHELRGRGYARRAIAAQLSAARAAGVTRSVLFTKSPSAVRCYEALGFSRIGEFSLVLLR
jgi:predicted GNAT family acetyltransferase